MKKLILIAVLAFVSLSSTFAQSTSDSISVNKVFGGYQFIYKDRPLTVKQLMSTLEVNEEAYKVIKSAKGSYDFAMVLSYAGGFLHRLSTWHCTWRRRAKLDNGWSWSKLGTHCNSN